MCSNDGPIVLKDSSHLYSNQWIYNNNLISTTDSVSVSYTSIFTVHTLDINTGCSITNTINVTPASTPWTNDFGWIRVGDCNENTYLFTPNFGTNDIESYSWDFGDGNISSYPSPTHTFPNGSDSFTVTFITKKYGAKYNNCNRSIAIHTMVAGCKGGQGSQGGNGGATGIGNVSNDIDLNVYPNLTTGIINITCKNLTSTTVFNLSGRVLFNTNKAEIDLSSLSNGIYILKIQTGDSTILRKIIKG